MGEGDGNLVSHGHRRTVAPETLCLGSCRPTHLTPEAGFPAMLSAEAADEVLMRFELTEILHADWKRLALEKMSCGVFVAGGFGAIERVLDHRATQ